VSQENVEIVRSIFAQTERGEFFGWGSLADPEIEFAIADGPDPGSWTGLRAVTAAWTDRAREFGGVRSYAEEYRALDSERVLVLTRTSGRGTASGIEVGAPGACVLHVRDAKVARVVVYLDRQNALAELGLAG
jgi:ketosteroid isomerase-like protein